MNEITEATAEITEAIPEALWEDTYGADLTIAETELWSDNHMGSFDDQDEIVRFEINDMSRTLLLMMRGGALGEICDPKYVPPAKKPNEMTFADTAFLNAVHWLRDVQLTHAEVEPVDMRRLAVEKIEDAMGEKDVIGWIIFFGYVVARRENPTLAWSDYKANTSRTEALKAGKKAFRMWRDYMDGQLEDLDIEQVAANYPLEQAQEAEPKAETGEVAAHGV